MHWQLGGNFGPVLKACEYRWMECSYALAHYIWFEVVTDVADSLANELVLWRILAVLLIFMTIIHFMYWKKQWIKEINITNESLKKIDLKVQDLELKISILTYKAQYDTWPLMQQQLVTVNNESDSESNSSIFPKSIAQSAYLKYFLARTRRKKIENKALMYNTEPQSLLSELNVCDVKTKCISSKFSDKLMQETSYIEKKLSLASLERKRVRSQQLVNKGFKNNSSTINLSEEPTTEDNFKLYRSSSDSSINDHLRSTYLGSKKITKINVKPGKLLHRKRISPEIAEKQLKFSISSTNNSSSSKNTLFPKFLKQNCHSLYQDNNKKEDTHETLNQVKEKLQCLHSSLPNYFDDFESNTLNTSHSSNKVCDNKKVNMSQDNKKFYYIKNQRGDYNYDECVSVKKHINNHNKSKSVNPDVIKENKAAKIISQTNGSNNSKLKKRNSFNSFAANNEPNYLHTEDVSNEYCSETQETKKNLLNDSGDQTKGTIIDSDNNQQINLVETSKESDSDDRSISSLIQEALKFKQELLLHIESRKEKEEINIQSIRNQSESYDHSNWHSDSDFEPNSLDKITEESCGSSIADKKSKTNILTTVENSNNQSKSNLSLLSQHKSNQIIENAISYTNCNEILLTDNNKQAQDEPEALSQNTEEIYHSNLNSNSKTDSNCNPLSDTSSDTSVNRLLDRLIESERKCKSAKSLTNAKIKEDAADSSNTFVIPHTFFDNAPFESKQDTLPVKFDTERHFIEKIDSGIESYENKNFDSTSLNTDEFQESETIDKYNYHNLNNDNGTLLSRDSLDSTNVVKSTIRLENNEMEIKNIINNKEAGDFYSDSEIIAQKTAQNSKKNVFPSGDSKSLESESFPKSVVKLKSNVYAPFCKELTGFKNSEQCSTKSSNSIQKQSVNSNFELGNPKQFKAKSNSNLCTIENVNTLPTHRRSKSHITSCDIPLMNQNKISENENILLQLDTEQVNHDKKIEEVKENLCASSEVSKKSFSKPCTPQSSRNCFNDIDIKFQMKENNSTSLSSKSSKSSIPIAKDSSGEINRSMTDIKRKPSNESVSSKSSTKSCIPILKTRLELAIKDDNDSYPKSSSSGSLKIVECFEPAEVINSFEENIEKQKNPNFIELIEEKDVIFTNSSDDFKLEYCNDSHDYVSTYINTMIDNIQLDTNTNNEKQIFDEFESELFSHTTSNNQIDKAFIQDEETSLIPEQRRYDDLTNVISQEACSLEVQSTTSRILFHKDSKETEVLVKPCTLDTSTSMTDVPNLLNASESKSNELKTEVYEQSSKEEYVTLLQLINDHPDFEHLLNLDLQK